MMLYFEEQSDSIEVETYVGDVTSKVFDCQPNFNKQLQIRVTQEKMLSKHWT